MSRLSQLLREGEPVPVRAARKRKGRALLRCLQEEVELIQRQEQRDRKCT